MLSILRFSHNLAIIYAKITLSSSLPRYPIVSFSNLTSTSLNASILHSIIQVNKSLRYLSILRPTSNLKEAIVNKQQKRTLTSRNNYLLESERAAVGKQHFNLNCIRQVAVKRKSLKVTETELPDRFKMEWPKISLFGDSITRRSLDVENGCWASMIGHQVASYFQVDVHGFEGYSTKWAIELMPKLFPKPYLDKVEIFIPFFGHNDSWFSHFPAHVPVDQYEINTRAMLKYLNDNGVGNKKIIMITPTWYHAETFLEWLEDSRYPPIIKEFGEAKKYSDVVLRIAKENNIDVIDFFDITAKYEPLEELFCDGVHYSKVGAKLLFDNLMPVIAKKIEASFKKPLADLWHVIPFDQRPDVVEIIKAHRASMTGNES